MSIFDDIDKLGRSDQKIIGQRFLAPYVSGGFVVTRVSGAVLRMKTRARSGWSIFEATSLREARFVEPASLTMRERYLDLFPSLSLVVAHYSADENDNHRSLLAVPVNDGRFHSSGSTPVMLPEPCQPMSLIKGRFDGSIFWFDNEDFDSHSDRLREYLASDTPLEDIVQTGLTPAHKAAYSKALAEKLQLSKEAFEQSTEGRIRGAIVHSGAEYVGHSEQADGFVVEYAITTESGTERYSSTIDRDFQVRSAGICLNGTDSNFDLTSLVNVVRQGQDRGLIHRF